MYSVYDDWTWLQPDCSIRKSADRCLHTAPRSLSQLIASFIGSQCQGIPLALFVAWPCVLFWIEYLNFNLCSARLCWTSENKLKWSYFSILKISPLWNCSYLYLWSIAGSTKKQVEFLTYILLYFLVIITVSLYYLLRFIQFSRYSVGQLTMNNWQCTIQEACFSCIPIKFIKPSILYQAYY